MTSSDKPPSQSSNSSQENTVDVQAVGVSDDEVPDDISEVAAAALSHMNRFGVEVSILICADPEMRELNLRYRDKDAPTDVLSFSQTEAAEPEISQEPVWPSLPEDGERPHIGDIVVSLDSVRRNADEWAIPYTQELRRVVVHGVLHLLGMDHVTNEPDQEMLQVQERILALISEEHKL